MIPFMAPMMIGSPILMLETVSSLPAMTSNSAPSDYVASASSEYPGNAAYMAADRSVNTVWSTNDNGKNGAFWMLKVPSPIRVGAIAITARTDPNSVNQTPTAFIVDASLNETDFTQLDGRSGLSAWSTGERRVFPIVRGLRGAYLYYRIRPTASDNAYYSFAELELLQEK